MKFSVHGTSSCIDIRRNKTSLEASPEDTAVWVQAWLCYPSNLWIFRITKNNIPRLWWIRKYFVEVEIIELSLKTIKKIEFIEQQMSNEVVRILGKNNCLSLMLYFNFFTITIIIKWINFYFVILKLMIVSIIIKLNLRYFKC